MKKNWMHIYENTTEKLDFGDGVRLNFNPDIQEMIAIKGCPPKPKSMVKALHQAGIDADPALFEKIDQLPGLYMSRYEGKPEFEETFFQVK